MKRRLSVAISLIGNPVIVFLDEPTTGNINFKIELTITYLYINKKYKSI